MVYRSASFPPHARRHSLRAEDSDKNAENDYIPIIDNRRRRRRSLSGEARRWNFDYHRPEERWEREEVEEPNYYFDGDYWMPARADPTIVPENYYYVNHYPKSVNGPFKLPRTGPQRRRSTSANRRYRQHAHSAATIEPLKRRHSSAAHDRDAHHQEAAANIIISDEPFNDLPYTHRQHTDSAPERRHTIQEARATNYPPPKHEPLVAPPPPQRRHSMYDPSMNSVPNFSVNPRPVNGNIPTAPIRTGGPPALIPPTTPWLQAVPRPIMMRPGYPVPRPMIQQQNLPRPIMPMPFIPQYPGYPADHLMMAGRPGMIPPPLPPMLGHHGVLPFATAVPHAETFIENPPFEQWLHPSSPPLATISHSPPPVSQIQSSSNDPAATKSTSSSSAMPAAAAAAAAIAGAAVALMAKKEEHKKEDHKKEDHKKEDHKKEDHKKEEHKKEDHKKEEHKKEEHKKEEHKKEEHKKEEHKKEEHKKEEHKKEEHKKGEPKNDKSKDVTKSEEPKKNATLSNKEDTSNVKKSDEDHNQTEGETAEASKTSHEKTSRSGEHKLSPKIKKEIETIVAGVEGAVASRKLQRRRSLFSGFFNRDDGNRESKKYVPQLLDRSLWDPQRVMSVDDAMYVEPPRQRAPPAGIYPKGHPLNQQIAKFVPPLDNRHHNRGVLSRKESQRIADKARRLGCRRYIWCYRPLHGPVGNTVVWSAFDAVNQEKLERYIGAVVNNEPLLPGTPMSITLSSEPELRGTIIVNPIRGIGQYYKTAFSPRPIMLQIQCLSNNGNFQVRGPPPHSDRPMNTAPPLSFGSRQPQGIVSRLWNAMTG
ncbi:hypothetical protein BX666DRAFT_1878384 [Dichotomocladium elegans]|nr:hypothetical protein BX666DRAFT_1878384 [Dichotomocladium elegans]